MRKSKLSHLSEEERLEHKRRIAREKARRYAERHPERRQAARRRVYEASAEREKARARAQHRPWTPERLARQKAHRSENRESVRAYQREYKAGRRETDIQFRLAEQLRSRLTKVVRNRVASAVRDLGCSLEELVAHLEGQFSDGMSWDNYGDWHVDHIIPLAFFDLTQRDQAQSASHYTNLQPKWAGANLAKGARLECPKLW